MTVTPDFVTSKNEADIDLVIHTTLIHSIAVIFKMFSIYHDEQEKAVLKAARRMAAKKERQRRRAEAKAMRAAETL